MIRFIATITPFSEHENTPTQVVELLFMSEYFLLFFGTVLVNNFVLVKFLGLCPFMGVSNKIETAVGMSLATTFVLTLTAALSYIVNTYLLAPLGLAVSANFKFYFGDCCCGAIY